MADRLDDIQKGMEFNALVLIKGSELFAYLYDDQSGDATLNAIHDAAADPEYNLNWFDAHVLCRKVREQVANTTQQPYPNL